MDSLGYGVRERALGGAGTALSRGPALNHYNPSLMPTLEGTELSLGYTEARFELHRAGERSSIEPVRAMTGALAVPGDVLGIPVAFGLGVQLPRGHLSKTRTIRLPDPYWVFYESQLQLFYISLNVAVEPVKWLSLGVGMRTLATTRGTFEVRGTAVVPLFEARDEYESDLHHQVDANLVSVRHSQFSLSLFPWDDLTIALTYRDEARLDNEVRGTLRGKIDLAPPGSPVEPFPVRYDLVTRTVTAFVPRQATLGVGFTPELWALGVDFAWFDWSSYQSPVSVTSTHVDVTPPEGILFTLPAGEALGVVDPGFHDSWALRVGAERTLRFTADLSTSLRVGYGYEPSPVPEQTEASNFLDADRHLASLGTGLRFAGLGPWLEGGLELDLVYVTGFLEHRQYRKTDPEAQPSYGLGGRFWSAGVELGAEF